MDKQFEGYEQHKELEDNKLGLLDERSKTQEYRMSARLSDFGYEFDKIKLKLKLTGDSMDISLSKIENLVSINGNTKVNRQLKEELGNLRNNYLSYNATLKNLGGQFNFSQQALGNVLIETSANGLEHYENSSLLIYIVTTFILLITTILLIIIRKRKSKSSNRRTTYE